MSANLADKPNATPSQRPIQTIYYRDKKLIRVNSSKYASNAVPLCVDHMQHNDYGATVAEVFDSITGELHAVVTHTVIGEIGIVFKRDVKRGE